MQLLLDIGNSKIKWGLLDEHHAISGVDSYSHREKALEKIAGDYWANITPSRVVVANVAGAEMAARLCALVEKNWQIAVEFLVPTAQAFGVRNGYQNPEQLGADRWAALIGAAQVAHGNLCIIDCGSALTIDILSAAKKHLGGLILPGRRLMAEALLNGTAQIRATSGAAAKILGCDTGSAVAAGTLYALIALIDRVSADLTAELPGPITVIITGGEAELIAPLLTGKVDYQPNLVLNGLAVIAQGVT